MATPAPGAPNGAPQPIRPPQNVPGPAQGDTPPVYDEVLAVARLGFALVTLLKEKGYLTDAQAAPVLDQLRFHIAQEQGVQHGQ